MKDYVIKQTINKEYIYDNCIQVSIAFNEKLCVICDDDTSSKIIFYYDKNNYNKYVNDYLKDNRRFKFVNYNIPVKMNIADNEQTYNANLLLEFDKLYKFVSEYKGKKNINYIKVTTLDQKIVFIQSSSLSSLEICKNKVKKIGK